MLLGASPCGHRPQPPDVEAYNNLAANLQDQGKYSQAQPLFEKALAIDRRMLTDDHPTTASSYNNVAANLDAQGKDLEAQGRRLRAVKSLDAARLRVEFTVLSLALTDRPIIPTHRRISEPRSYWPAIRIDPVRSSDGLRKSDRAIRIHESFPLFPPTKRHDVLYCLVSELAEFGTIHDHLDSTRRPWSQERAVGEILALLKLLDQLHGTGALHRYITPMNVFLRKNRRLKLGDFGIAGQVPAEDESGPGRPGLDTTQVDPAHLSPRPRRPPKFSSADPAGRRGMASAR